MQLLWGLLLAGVVSWRRYLRLQTTSKQQAVAAEAARERAELILRDRESTIEDLQRKINDQSAEKARIQTALEEARLKVERAGTYCAQVAPLLIPPQTG